MDDEPLILEMTASCCKSWDVKSSTAATGKRSSLRLAKDLHIEILITDINMPGMGGYELADRATRVRNGLQVILLSGRESDCHGFPLIRKPFRKPISGGLSSRLLGFARIRRPSELEVSARSLKSAAPPSAAKSAMGPWATAPSNRIGHDCSARAEGLISRRR